MGPLRRTLVAVVPLILLGSAAVGASSPAGAGQTAAAAGQTAAGAPGVVSHFDLARKDCLGTARNTTSKVWFTVADGVLSDVYNPTIDTTNLETLQLVVTDGRTFTDLQTRDTTYTVRSTDRSGMVCQVVSSSVRNGYRLVTDYVTDPGRDSVVMRTRVESRRRDLQVFVRYDATIGGNGGGGPVNGGADDATVDPATTALVSSDTNTVTNAVNRDYAVPTFGAVRADRPFAAAQSGFAGTASDGLTQLDAARRLTSTATEARQGNVVQTAQLDLRHDNGFTLALGYGRTAAQAVGVAGASARTSFDRTRSAYTRTWREYDERLAPPPGRRRGESTRDSQQTDDLYWLSANVLKASEDKTFPGAVVASVASPWGQAVSAADKPGGRPVYFGSYREVFSRDLYEAFTGLLAAGDRATARDTVRFLFERQQLADGRLPRNSLVNGKKAPDTGGDQLDESAYPILMALQAGLDHDKALYRDHIRRAADFVVAHGPSFGSERWEEQGGFSPSTIAAEIAGLVAAGQIADSNGDRAAARVYRATADHFQRSIKGWTVTTTGPYGTGRYFIRLSKNGNPDEAVRYNLGNGSIEVDQRSVVDAGFLELTRLGILSAGDPDVVASLGVVDQVIRRDTASGPGFYRYGTSLAGSEDGYGDCFAPDPTNCTPSGKPWPTGNVGSGHLWPVLADERAEQALQSGDRAQARTMLASMQRMASGVGLVPEQAWENPDLAASPFGTDPAVASIGFADGKAVGSASPLTWSQATEVRLIQSIGAGRPVEQPVTVRQRYARGSVPLVPITITAPTDGTSVNTPTATLHGSTAPGATVDVQATAVDFGGGSTIVTTTAGPDGTFTVTVPTPLGSNAVTAAATTPDGRTGWARITIVSDFITGTTVLDVTDPDGDDNGPGTYGYPTDGQFHAGAFDIERFQVIDTGDQVLLRTRLRDLSPTFGSPLGAQLLDVYVHQPGAATTSTAAAFTSRNYTIDPASAWSERLEAQGFADTVFVNPTGDGIGAATTLASQPSRTITIVAPKAAFGAPGPGWSFTVVLHGQDGFSPDQARAFTALPEGFSFGVCRPGVSSPICAVNPATVPKAMDVLTPAGVAQATELDPSRGPVVVHGVPVG